MTMPALWLQDAARVFGTGDNVVRALNNVSLRVEQGDFVAIMGQSGSGKSTLMNILGCLDHLSSGQYHILGRDVATLDSDSLAQLRRETFGFVFQRYHLLPSLTAVENVEIPAVYAGVPPRVRRERAFALLQQLGLAQRAQHRPAHLSGGQQQRVAIARALMNNAPIILADEPTGALDSKSGAEVMALLHQLHQQGRTIVLITHDAHVAQHAQRTIRMQDGMIIDSGIEHDSTPPVASATSAVISGTISNVQSMREATHMALKALHVNWYRTALTLLGIIIGVAAVVVMLAVGSGSKQKVIEQISAMGTNLLYVRPGAPGVRVGGDVATLIPEDAEAIASLPNVVDALPERGGRFTVRYKDTDDQTTVQGTGANFSVVRDWPLAQGQFFSSEDVKSYAPVAVLGMSVRNALFAPHESAVGRYILLKNIPVQVVGVLSAKGASASGVDQDDSIFMPYSTALVRVFGKNYLSNITVQVADVSQIDATQTQITTLLRQRHQVEDFKIRNMASVIATASDTQDSLTLLLGIIAAVSLFVGGIGVMNIMLVSVTERTREIGLRIATGARRYDILLQFNIESVMVCALGGILGLLSGFMVGVILQSTGVRVIFTLSPAVLAFSSACITGIVFGYLPARKAARMNTVVALSAE